jgi:hypothetical protein
MPCNHCSEGKRTNEGSVKKHSLKFEEALHDRESDIHEVKIGSAWRLAVAYTLRLTVPNRWASLTRKLQVKSLKLLLRYL